MKTLNSNTQQAKNFIRNYLFAIANKPRETIYKMYARPSQKKIEAFNDCLKLKTDLNGYEGTITGGNCDKFNYAFKCKENGKEYLIYITADNDYKIALN